MIGNAVEKNRNRLRIGERARRKVWVMKNGVCKLGSMNDVKLDGEELMLELVREEDTTHDER